MLAGVLLAVESKNKDTNGKGREDSDGKSPLSIS